MTDINIIVSKTTTTTTTTATTASAVTIYTDKKIGSIIDSNYSLIRIRIFSVNNLPRALQAYWNDMSAIYKASSQRMVTKRNRRDKAYNNVKM